MNSQKIEADQLRCNVSAAAEATSQAHDGFSNHLETCLNEERKQASQDRQNLLSQIITLINQSGEVQDARWSSKINAVRDEIALSRSSSQAANKEYNTGMDAWSQKEKLLVDEVLTSRDTLKSKMKEDWKAINEHNISIQATTKSVHEETIRIVDAQMKDMASQMQALDDFVTRARSQNERHHSRHVDSLAGLATTVGESYSSIGKHFVSTYDRVRDIGKDISAQSTALSASLPPLASSIQQPLSDLRAKITDAPLKEYAPTGETPQKTQYPYPTHLPRTQSHDELLGKQPQSVPGSPQRSPSKSIVYTDATSDENTGLPPSASPSKDGNPASLREISLNVKASLIRNNSDPSAPTSKVDPDVVSMGPPPLKRQATESKLPQKFAGKPGFVKLEGRENFGAGRRLRSSPTG